jgi:lysophospholipase L1-like esterase
MNASAAPSRSKKILFSLVAILMGLVLALAIAEGALRLTRTAPYHRNALNAFHQPDPRLGWRGLPGFSGVFVREDFKARIAINEQGYRKKDARTEPLPDAEKVVFLGDSFAWGWGVSQGELFSDVLQDLLGPRYDVINMGINTFGTVQEWIQTESEVIAMRPSRVGVLVYGNDLEDNMNGRGNSRPYCVVKGGRVVLRNLPVANPIGGAVRSVTSHSYALTHLRYYHNVFREYVDLAEARVKQWLRGRSGGDEKRLGFERERGAAGDEHAMQEMVMVFEHALARIAGLCRANGIDPFVVYVPTGDNIASGRPEYDIIRIVRGVCRRHDIPLVDLMPDFMAGITGTEGEPYYFPLDLHWTAEGHRLAAEVISRWVFENARTG